jgi:RecJ-like exonuclease
MSTTKIPEGYIADARGRLVPLEALTEQDKRRDALVKGLVAEALELEELIATKRASMQARVDEYLDWLKGVKKVKRENWKGNVQLDSYDGTLRIDRRVTEVISFNETLQLAKTAVDEWLKDNLEGVNDELRAVIMGAFSVDQKGRVNKGQILKLLRFAIKGPKWKKAMDLVRDAIQIQTTRQSTVFYVRDGKGEWRQVVLAFVSSEIQYDESAERDG